MSLLWRVVVTLTFVMNLCGEAEGLTSGGTRREEVHNPHIDIALMLDNSGSMHWTWDKSGYVWEGMKQWIRDYYNKDTEIYGKTKLAVIACGVRNINGGEVEPSIYFDQNKDHQVASDLINKFADLKRNTKPENHSEGKADNVNGCAKAVATKIFDANRDRPNAPNVAVYVSDCTFYVPNNNPVDQLEQMKKLQEKLHLFLFVCTGELNKTSMGLMNQWLNGDTRKVYIYEDKTNLVKKLDDFLPKVVVNITTCGYDVKTSPCQFQSNGMCSKIKYPVIVVQPSPAQYIKESDKCPKDEAIDCDPKECSGPIPTAEAGTLTNGTDVAAAGRLDEQGKNEDEDDGSSGVIIGIVIGILVVLILAILVLLLFLTRRKKGGKKHGHGYEWKHKEKEKGLYTSMSSGPGHHGHAYDAKHREKEKGMHVDITKGTKGKKGTKATKGKTGKRHTTGKKATTHHTTGKKTTHGTRPKKTRKKPTHR